MKLVTTSQHQDHLAPRARPRSLLAMMLHKPVQTRKAREDLSHSCVSRSARFPSPCTSTRMHTQVHQAHTRTCTHIRRSNTWVPHTRTHSRVHTHTQPHHRPRTGTPYTHRPTHLHVHPHNLEKNRGGQRESGTLSIYLKDTKPNFNRGHLSQTSKGATIWIHRSLHQKPLLQPQGCKRLQKSRRLAVLREAASTVALGCHLGICTWGVFPFA